MLTLFRWLLLMTIGLIAGIVLLAVLIWYFAIRSVPDYDATLISTGISAPVEIVRSTENVPHIFGETDEDVFYALGLAHAQDRLFQMTALRRAAQGRLSEIYGPRTFAADDLARRLGIHRSAVEALQAQDPQTRAALTAYASGVNRWIAQVNEQALGRGAPEFFLYPGDIAYWQPADSLAILKLLALGASTALPDEVMRARLSLADPRFGPEVTAHPADPALPEYAAQFPGARFLAQDRAAAAPDRATQLAGFISPGLGMSGTGFATPPARTAMGGSILANDPQVPLTAPALWYLARIELRSGGVIGATIPGIPAILSGRNTALAWGMTPAGIDDADIFIEEVQPGNPNRYRGERGWTDFQVRRELIRVRDSEDRAITLRETANGAVLPGIDYDLSHVTPMGHVAAVRWTGGAADDRSMSALIALMQAGDRAAAETALAALTAPAMQVTLADRRGVAQLLAGALPDRDPANPTGGMMPVPGWLPESGWRGMGPAAHPLIPETEGAVLATGEGPGGPRMGRLRRLIQSRDVHSRDSMVEAQLDIVSPVARSLLPLVGADLWFTGEPAAPGTPERQRQDALKLLAEWDGAMNEHLPEPLIHSAWMAQLQKRLI